MKKQLGIMVLVALAIVVVAALLVSFPNLTSNTLSEPVVVQEDTGRIVAFASWAKINKDLPSLIRDSELIIIGEVIESKPFLRIDMVFTLQTVRVQKVLKGEVKPGDVVEILQTGGSLEDEGIERPPFREDPLFELGSTHLLFLYRSSTDPWWLITGGFQGRAEVRGGQLQIVEQVVELEDPVGLELHNRSLSQIETLVSDLSERQ